MCHDCPSAFVYFSAYISCNDKKTREHIVNRLSGLNGHFHDKKGHFPDKKDIAIVKTGHF